MIGNAHWGIMITAACTLSLLAPIGVEAQEQGTGGRCIPATERGERTLGCFIVARQSVGSLPSGGIFWHVHRFSDAQAAEQASGDRGTVVDAFDETWLLTIEAADWRPPAGDHMATIGPLPVQPAGQFTAQYMEATFVPGMKSGIAQRSGPEAWYTLSGESCLETPSGAVIGRAGGDPVIAPPGVPMQITATGTEERRALVLVLHDSSKPPATPVADWQPKGLCDRPRDG